jgi:hypothetical protein
MHVLCAVHAEGQITTAATCVAPQLLVLALFLLLLALSDRTDVEACVGAALARQQLHQRRFGLQQPLFGWLVWLVGLFGAWITCFGCCCCRCGGLGL